MSWPLSGPFMGGADYDRWKTDPDPHGYGEAAEMAAEVAELEAIAEPLGPHFEPEHDQ